MENKITQRTLVIRADADSKMGSGHVMRCLALAQEWRKRGGEVAFLTSRPALGLKNRFQREGIDLCELTARTGSLQDAEETVKLAISRKAQSVVIDGYQFDSHFQKVVRGLERYLCVIDDYGHADHYFADLVVNQNAHATEKIYSKREPHTQLFLGTHYALLRQEFLKWKGWKREILPVAKKILVTLGGGDSSSTVITVLKSFPKELLKSVEIKIVVGGGMSLTHEFRSALKDLQLPVTLEKDPQNMAELMAWADIAISGGGGTSWELAFMGLPSALIVLAENQRESTEKLAEAQCVISLGLEDRLSEKKIAGSIGQLISSSELRLALSRKGRELVDGEGVNRILQRLK